MDYSLVSVVGVVFAFAMASVVTVIYPTLVNLRGNPGARLFFTLLLSIDALITLSLLRGLLGDYPFREPLLAFFFYVLGGVLAMVGWRVWKRQSGGALERRERKLRDRA